MPINSQHPDYDRTKSDVCKDAYSGNVQNYIPRLTGQSNSEYARYVERAAYLNVVKRTAGALTGVMLRKPYTTNVETEDIMVGGNINFDEFLSETITTLLISGRLGLLVDYDDNEQLPYITTYENSNITNWRDNDYGQFVIINEDYYRPDPKDPYEVELVQCYRELVMLDGVYTVRVWEQDRKEWKVTEEYEPQARGQKLEDIPFVFVNTKCTTSEVTDPILFNMSQINIGHFRTNVDVEHAAHFTALPQPYLSGDLQESQSNLPIGTYEVWQLTEGSTVGYLEFSGKGITSLQEIMAHKEEQMVDIGSRLLSGKKGVESVEALRIRQGSEVTTLVQLANVLDSAMIQILECYYKWMGQEVEVEFEMNKDFVPSKIPPEELRALLEAVVAGKISNETFLDNLREGEIVDDVDEEVARLSGQSTEVEDNVE